MDVSLGDWVNLLLRWIHLIAGIAWIGSSFFFMWLDSHLVDPSRPSPETEGELWMVHSGGFYFVEKKLLKPGWLPAPLHWFKWEATLTWLSGFALLTLVYYMGAEMYLVDPSVSRLSPGTAVAIGIGVLVGSWIVYDLLWISPIGQHNGVATAVSCLLLGGLVYGLCHVFSGRAAYIHVGALFGTVMVANVWARILPAQRDMLAAAKDGRHPDYTLGRQAKRRSVHNSYMTLPVLLVMLSNHYPMTYGHQYNDVLLILLIGVGAGVRHVMIVRRWSSLWALTPAVAIVVLLGVTSRPAAMLVQHPGGDGARVSFAAARAVIEARCLSCHSAKPQHPSFPSAPSGVVFDAAEQIKAMAARIKFRAVVTQTMPLANMTEMTVEERALLGRWIDEGAHIE
jgi:uncharacterized membrane protein